MKIHLTQCKQQQEDIKKIIAAHDENIAMAIALNQQGSMGYQLFIQSREEFHKLVHDLNKNYRLIEDSTD